MEKKSVRIAMNIAFFGAVILVAFAWIYLAASQAKTIEERVAFNSVITP